MIDLTNKSVDEINSFIQRYAHALEIIPPAEQPVMAYIINVGMIHLTNVHSEINGEVKACAIVVLRKLQNILNEDDDIRNMIDDFIEFYNDKFKSFVHELYPQSSADGMIYEFMLRFINKKLGI